MKKQLAIVGNGFDMAHNLKTSYGSFTSKLPEDVKIEWEKLLAEHKVKDDSWYAFEDAIDEMTAEWQSRYFNSVVDVLKINEEELMDKITQINNLFDKMTRLLFEYISAENKKEIKIQNIIKKKLTRNCHVISFNYTKTIENYSDNVYYIHGSVSEGEIILGYKLRTEHSGINVEATKFSKNKLREMLNYRRFLQKSGIKKEQLDKELNFFKPHLTRLFSGRGGYVFDYTEETDRLINEVLFDGWNTYYNGYFSRMKALNLPKDLEEIARKERLTQISKEINSYGELNNFSQANIETSIPYSEINELLILGHSLKADIEIITDLFNHLINLEKVILFVYKGEDYAEKKDILVQLSNCEIEIEFYE
ncbi:AbiH family protein [Carnobacterium maltaromaticum]|uniref:AbiH family protein n=1 Tax=Carnobacterium maltaromaticum TaxID=2751 RepID=UPI00295F083F|nr:AbiH family protein [Carnobacterium maltaromaticum]